MNLLVIIVVILLLGGWGGGLRYGYGGDAIHFLLMLAILILLLRFLGLV